MAGLNSSIHILGQELLTPPPGMAARVFVALPCSPFIHMLEFPFCVACGAKQFLYCTQKNTCSYDLGLFVIKMLEFPFGVACGAKKCL